MDIGIQRTEHPRPRTAPAAFGASFTDHMFLMDHAEGRGWHSPRIAPYGPIALEPSASALQYGQGLFDGLKAFQGEDGKVRLFRPDFHAARFSAGAPRLCMPSVPPDLQLKALKALLDVDRDWVPRERGASLYLRPTIIGTEGFLGVRPSRRYLFYIIASPVGPYFPQGFSAVSIKAEEKYVRAAPGGLGAVKAGANYAAGLLAGEEAKALGFSQVLWLDAREGKYAEEVGMMNIFFVIGDTVETPPLSGGFLNGCMRDSVIRLLRGWGLKVAETKTSMDDLIYAHRSGQLKEVFGTGTAAVIAPVGKLACGGEEMVIHGNEPGPLAKKLFAEITAIQYGEAQDRHGWMLEV